MTPSEPTSMLSAAELETIRAALPAVQQVAYLNAGTLGPLPRAAIDAVEQEQHLDATVRQSATHWDQLQAAQEDARGAITALTGVAADQAALMHTTHEGINACLWGLGLERGDTIVTTDEEHPGLLVPLRHVRDRLSAETRVAPWMDGDDAFVHAVMARVDPSTRAVALSHVSWQSGRVAPLRALRDALPDDVRLIVDGAQSAGVLAIDPRDGWDAYTVSGQKWPCGPSGSGGVAFADPEAWLPTFGAYMQLTDGLRALDPASTVVTTARRFEQSQEVLGPLAGFAASVQWLVHEVGLDRARTHAAGLNERARARLMAGGIGPERLHGELHLLAIDVDGAVELAARLLDAGFLQRSLTATRLRLSFGCWNTPDEVDGVVDAILEQASAST